MQKLFISIYVPCFNQENSISDVYRELMQVLPKMQKYAFELIFIDNGSTDQTRKEIEKLKKDDSRVTGIYLSRNFGPESASQAGLDHAKGDAVIKYPCYLKNVAAVIPQFIEKWEQGYDSVLGINTIIEDPFWMGFLRKKFYQIMKYISDIEIPVQSSGITLMSRRVVSAMNTLPETYRFGRGIRSWVGFRTAFVEYQGNKRKNKQDSYSLISYYAEAQRSVFGFSYLPLDLLIYFGFLLVIISFLFIIFYLCFFFLYGNPIKGAVTILVAIVFFGGINLLALSIIGKYIQVIVEETKKRPFYIVDKVIRKGLNSYGKTKIYTR